MGHVGLEIVCLIYMYAFPFTGTIFRLQVHILTLGTLARIVHISVWQIGVGHAGICPVFAGVPKIRICTCKRKIAPEFVPKMQLGIALD